MQPQDSLPAHVLTPVARVRIPTPLRAFTSGQSELSCSGETVRAALRDLERQHPALAGRILDERGDLRRFVNVFVGEKNLRSLGGLDLALPRGAELSIVPAVAGGAA